MWHYFYNFVVWSSETVIFTSTSFVKLFYSPIAHLNLFSRLHMESKKTQIQALFSPPFLELQKT